MVRALAWFLTLLILLQTFSRELTVLDYQVHKARITKMFCVNKARPQLHCNGRCHLAKQLRKATDQENKAPGAGLAKMKYDALPLQRFVCQAPTVWPAAAPVFSAQRAQPYAFAWAGRIFHPPAFRG